MLERLRSKLGPAGLIVSIMALVLAVAGGAIAAGGALTGKQKKEVKNIAKQYAGKPGAQGPAGPAGAAGAKGDAGAPGAKGADGTDGTNGTKGATGATGATGPEGDPWAAGGTLPPGETLTGIWGINNSGQSPPDEGDPQGYISIPISFTIPLEEAPEEIVYVEASAPTTDCPGMEEGIPAAAPGKLCVYSGEMEGMVRASAQEFAYPETPVGDWTEWKDGASAVGTIFRVKCTASFCRAGGYWAVTAAE